jgi:hypothetical protein
VLEATIDAVTERLRTPSGGTRKIHAANRAQAVSTYVRIQALSKAV